MPPAPQPLSTSLRPIPAGRTSPQWSAHFWLTEAAYSPPGAPHRRSNFQTRVRVERGDAHWVVFIECDAGPANPAAPPLRAIGDPDMWQSEFVQLQLPVGDEGGCLHLSVSRAGQTLSERFDKQRDPIAGWCAAAEETGAGWRARIVVPRANIPEAFQLRLARWVPGEGVTRWPTPFGTWWHVESPDFLVITEHAPPNDLNKAELEAWIESRETALLAATGTPDPRAVKPGQWWRDASGFLNVPLHREGDFLNYLHRRLEELPSLAFETLPAPDLDRCRRLLAGGVYYEDGEIDLGPSPDWDSDHHNFYVMVHATRFDFLADLVAAFRQSGDEAFGRGAVALIESWLQGHDIRQSLTPKRYPIRWGTGIIVSHRLVCMVRTLFSLLPAGLVPEELFIRVFAAVREAAHVLSPGLSRLYPKNHSIIIGDHMVQLSVLCRELRAAESIRENYWQHLRRALETQILPDGVQAELSTMYHFVCYARLTEATDACERAAVPVPDDITAWRRRILSVAAKYLFPNGQVAGFNDGSMSGEVDTIGEASSTLRDCILADAPVLGAEEALAIASGGGQGRAATEISDALLYAGHYILRDGLAPDSMALAFDAGPFGLAHAHEDALSLMLVRYGKPLLIDIGSGAYDPTVPMRGYSTSTASHSTISIDGQGQGSRFVPAFWKRAAPWAGHHHFGRHVQFAHGEYTHGYGDAGAINVDHQRAVVFVSGQYVLLIDYLLGEGTRLVESHFAVAPLPYHLTPRGLRTTSGDGDLDIALLYPKHTGADTPPVIQNGARHERSEESPRPEQAAVAPGYIHIAHGQTDPYAGWMPQSGYGEIPHPRLTYSLPAQQLPCCLVTLLLPFEREDEIPTTQVRESAESIEIEIEKAGARSILTCRRQPLDISLRRDQGHFRALAQPDGTVEFEDRD